MIMINSPLKVYSLMIYTFSPWEELPSFLKLINIHLILGRKSRINDVTKSNNKDQRPKTKDQNLTKSNSSRFTGAHTVRHQPITGLEPVP